MLFKNIPNDLFPWRRDENYHVPFFIPSRFSYKHPLHAGLKVVFVLSESIPIKHSQFF